MRWLLVGDGDVRRRLLRLTSVDRVKTPTRIATDMGVPVPRGNQWEAPPTPTLAPASKTDRDGLPASINLSFNEYINDVALHPSLRTYSSLQHGYIDYNGRPFN
jgi:hypothetical protein